MGKRSLYEERVLPNLEHIEEWARAGVTMKDIAAKLKIARSTLFRFVTAGQNGDERYKDLSDAFARGCVVSDDAIETALFDRARGITYEERTVERVWNKAEEVWEEVCTKRVTKYIPPDPTSAMFWLTNRRPEKWKYKPEARDEDGDEGSGVVVLAPVMESPEPPTEGENADG